MVLHHHVYIVFLLIPPIAHFKLTNCPSSAWLTLILESWIQYRRTVKPLGGATRRLIFTQSRAANSQISDLIRHKMQLTDCDYGNDMRNAICVEDNVLTCITGPTVQSLYCVLDIDFHYFTSAVASSNPPSLNVLCENSHSELAQGGSG